MERLMSSIVRLGSQSQKFKIQKSKVKSELVKIQNDLFDIGSMLASPDSKRILNLKQRVETFEVLIDQLTSEIPELSHFILPGGGRAGSQLHFCRTVCRRAERRIVE